MTARDTSSTPDLFGFHQLPTQNLGTAPIFSWTPTNPVCSTSMSCNYDQPLPAAICRDGQEGGNKSQGAQNVRGTVLPDRSTSEFSSEISDVLIGRMNFSSSDHEDQQQLEQYVNDLVPVLNKMVNKSTRMDMQDILQRQEAFKLITANAALGARATGMAWGGALTSEESARAIAANGNNEGSVLDGGEGHGAANFLSAAGEAAGADALDNFGAACGGMVDIDQGTQNIDEISAGVLIKAGDVECSSASSSYGDEISDPAGAGFGSVFHRHESTASLALSDRSSIVDSSTTSSEQLNMQEDMMECAFNFGSCSNAADHLYAAGGTDTSAAELLVMQRRTPSSVQAPASIDMNDEIHTAVSKSSADELYGEINARLAMIRDCCREWKGDQEVDAAGAGRASLQVSGDINYAAGAAGAISMISNGQLHVDGVGMLKGLHHHEVKQEQLASATSLYDHLHDDDVACQSRLPDVAPFLQLRSTEVAQIAADVAFHNSHHHDVTYCAVGAAAPVLAPVPYYMACAGAELAQHNINNLTGRCKSDVVAGGQAEGLMDQNGHVDAAAMLVGSVDVANELERQRASLYANVDGGVTKRGSHTRGGNKGYDRSSSDGGLRRAREMMYRVAAYRPIDWGSIMEELVQVGKERPRRRNVRISEEPQSVAARRRRERIGDRIRILQRLVPGASKLDTASMLDEAIHYLKFLKLQVQALRRLDRFYSFNSAVSNNYMTGNGSLLTTAPPHNINEPPPPPPASTSSSASSSSSSQYYPQPPPAAPAPAPAPLQTSPSFSYTPSLLQI